MRCCAVALLSSFISLVLQPSASDKPSAQSLIERHAKEKSPVWVDGNTATFFYRGEAEEVKLFIGGEEVKLHRLSDSDVWTVTVTKPDMAKGIFTYAILPGKKNEPIQGKQFHFQRWRGPQAPPAVARVKELKGQVRTVDFESKALGEKRKVRVYLPPGHDRTKTYPVIYATDGNDGAQVLEALIVAGNVPSLITVATSSGGYLGDRAAAYDTHKDLRALEYLSGFDAKRYATHEKFFCEEIPAWAEREFGASKDRKDRAIFGCSNGARFAVDMGVRHPDFYGHVFAFSVAGRRELPLADKVNGLPHFHLAAGTWEMFLQTTKNVANALKKPASPSRSSPASPVTTWPCGTMSWPRPRRGLLDRVHRLLQSHRHVELGATPFLSMCQG